MPEVANAVVGYGLPLSIQRFLQVFPGTFAQTGPNEWEATPQFGQVENQLARQGILLYYSRPETGGISDLFLTSTDALVVEEYQGGRLVIGDRLLTNAPAVGNWILQTFPRTEPNVYLYAYSTFE